MSSNWNYTEPILDKPKLDKPQKLEGPVPTSKKTVLNPSKVDNKLIHTKDMGKGREKEDLMGITFINEPPEFPQGLSDIRKKIKKQKYLNKNRQT